MNSGRISTLKRRERRRRHTVVAGPKLVASVAALVVGLLWAVGVGLYSYYSIGGGTVVPRSSRFRQLVFRDFPEHVIDIWPDDTKNVEFVDTLKSCVDEDRCLEHDVGFMEPRIAVLRPPGVFGKSLQGFLEKFVQNHRAADSAAKPVLLPTSHILNEQQQHYTKIIRFATLPVLLEAMDLALETLDNTFVLEQIGERDVLGVVRLLVRWHCRLSKIAADSALLTLSQKIVLSHPKDVKRVLEEYLGLEVSSSSSLEEQDTRVMNDVAKVVLRRIDECILLASQLERRKKQDLEAMVEEAILDELENDECGPLLPTREDDRVPETRVTEIVGHLLDENEESSLLICKKYPKIPLCRDGSTDKLVA